MTMVFLYVLVSITVTTLSYLSPILRFDGEREESRGELCAQKQELQDWSVNFSSELNPVPTPNDNRE